MALYQITDPDRALGPEPHDLGQRADRQRARRAIERVHAKQRARTVTTAVTSLPVLQARTTAFWTSALRRYC